MLVLTDWNVFIIILIFNQLNIEVEGERNIELLLLNFLRFYHFMSPPPFAPPNVGSQTTELAVSLIKYAIFCLKEGMKETWKFWWYNWSSLHPCGKYCHAGLCIESFMKIWPSLFGKHFEGDATGLFWDPVGGRWRCYGSRSPKITTNSLFSVIKKHTKWCTYHTTRGNFWILVKFGGTGKGGTGVVAQK